MKKKLLFLLMFCLIIPCSIIFTGCASTSKSEISAAISTDISFTYNSEDNTTRIDFLLHFENNTIYNMTKEDCVFKLYKDNQFVKDVNFYWLVNVNTNSSINRNSYIIVEGEFDKMELFSWTASFESVWKTYKTWWLISIIAPIVIAIIYLVVVLYNDLDLSDVVENIGTWIGTVSVTLLSFIPLFIFENWMPFVICLGGCVFAILLCLLMSGVRALLEMNDLNPFNKLLEKKYEKHNNKIIELIDGCIYSKLKLQSINKNDLLNYCEIKNIEVSGRKKEDIVNSIILSVNSDTKNNKNTIKKKISNKITFKDIAGLESAKKAFKEKVILPFEHPELYKKFNKKAGGGILLYGLPGTGKTMFAEAASNEVDALFIPIKCSDIKSKWYGESEQKIKEVFTKARKAKKAVIFFDEFEAIGAKRTDSSDNGNNDLVPEILAEMQGVGNSNSDSTVVVIAATNKPWSIDSAFLRPGRFDEKIYIPLPDVTARKKLFELKLKDIPTKDIDYLEISKLTEGFNGADITEFCEKLKMEAINKSLVENTEHIITMNDVIEVSKKIKSSVLNDDIEQLKNFQNKF